MVEVKDKHAQAIESIKWCKEHGFSNFVYGSEYNSVSLGYYDKGDEGYERIQQLFKGLTAQVNAGDLADHYQVTHDGKIVRWSVWNKKQQFKEVYSVVIGGDRT